MKNKFSLIFPTKYMSPQKFKGWQLAEQKNIKNTHQFSMVLFGPSFWVKTLALKSSSKTHSLGSFPSSRSKPPGSFNKIHIKSKAHTKHTHTLRLNNWGDDHVPCHDHVIPFVPVEETQITHKTPINCNLTPLHLSPWTHLFTASRFGLPSEVRGKSHAAKQRNFWTWRPNVNVTWDAKDFTKTSLEEIVAS